MSSIYNSADNHIDQNNNLQFNHSDPEQSVINLISPTDGQNQPHTPSRSYAPPKRKNTVQHNSQLRGSNGASVAATPSSVVPTLTNVNEIFHLLSQKIAKYCQILADLTNCEVFYKAQLQQGASEGQTPHGRGSKKSRYNNPNNSCNSRHHRSNQTKKRSLYWGTHQMLFQYSHNQGLKYDKHGGDSLIKLNQRSISTDVTNLIEEILNAPSLSLQHQEDTSNFDDLRGGLMKEKTRSPSGTGHLEQQQAVIDLSSLSGGCNDVIKSTVQLIDTGDIEGLGMEAAEKVMNSEQVRMTVTQKNK